MSYISMPSRHIAEAFQIDTNRINARQSDPAMNLLEQWHNNGVIHITMSEIAQTEARQGQNVQRINKGLIQIYSVTHANSSDELRTIEQILFPAGAVNSNQKNDVEIVFNAGKYGKLITKDNGILDKRLQLRHLGIEVMTPSEAVILIRRKIEERDKRALRASAMTHKPIPNWVGRD